MIRLMIKKYLKKEFTMKHPDEGERIMEILSEYSPQDEIY
jgi:hypothetical protein